MKQQLGTDPFAKYGLDRFAARPWNQSSWFCSEGKWTQGTSAWGQLTESRLATKLLRFCGLTLFVLYEMLSSNFSRAYLTKLLLLVSECCEEIKKNKWKSLFTNPQGPCRYILSLISLHYYFTLSVLVYQSHSFCCALKPSHKLTCWIFSWDLKLQGIKRTEEAHLRPLPLGNCSCSYGVFIGWISYQMHKVQHLKSTTNNTKRQMRITKE